MPSWLLDSSVLLASEDPDDVHHRDASRLLRIDEPLSTVDIAYYEVTNVAIRAWRDVATAKRLRDRVTALSEDGGLIRADSRLLGDASDLAHAEGISVYDAAFVVAAVHRRAGLVSCDVRDLVARGLARLPGDALAESQ